MKRKQDLDPFVARIREDLEESVDRLDSNLTMRLRRARQRALNQDSPGRPERRRPVRWAIAGAAATMILMGILFLPGKPPLKPQYVSSFEDLELLSAADTPEFFSELDFYTWLAEEVDNAV